jgi:hypothetical protein
MRRRSSGQERRHFRELVGFCTSLLRSELVTLSSAQQNPSRPRRFSIGLLLSEVATAVRFWLGFLGLWATLHQLATFRIGNAELSVAKPVPATAILHRLASFRIGNGGAILVRLLGLSASLHLFATFRIGNAELSVAKPAPATAIFHRLASFRIGNGGAILARLLELAGFCISLLRSELVTLGSAWRSPSRPRQFSIGLLLSELATAVRLWFGSLAFGDFAPACYVPNW